MKNQRKRALAKCTFCLSYEMLNRLHDLADGTIITVSEHVRLAVKNYLDNTDRLVDRQMEKALKLEDSARKL